MNPAQAIAWVEGLDILGMRFGLERMSRLLAALGDPQRAQPAIHVVGTNGKTSTVRLAAAALTSAGLRTGAYLSPHVTGWAERIEVAGAPLDDAALAAALTRVRRAADDLDREPGDDVTQFEALTAAAFLTLAEAGLDAAVIEAGLGGRYDATNVLRGGRVTVLTNVALEHTELLGDTHAAIAAEKLAVAPDGSDRLVVGRLSPAAAAAVDAECARRGLSGWRVGREVEVDDAGEALRVRCPGAVYDDLRLGVRGRFQHDNVAVAVAAAQRFLHRPPAPGPLRAALAAVRVPGRLELFPGRPPVLMDGAHNPDGMEALVASLPGIAAGRPVVAVVSLLDDKDAAAMLGALAPAVAALVATRSRHRRARPPADLRDAAEAAGARAHVEDAPSAALAWARGRAGGDGLVLVCGSLYLLADLRPALVAGGTAAPARAAGAA
ncbi:MAG TPA: cyanophycin synthetase [Miltoncostaeaceae bacterium]|nr:cyanophycin synthetase [Miltoncostaeaceae bacterium]